MCRRVARVAIGAVAVAALSGSGAESSASTALFADTFESGSLSAWTTTTTGTTGLARAEAVPGQTGSYAAHLSSSDPASSAHLRRVLAEPVSEFSVSLRVAVLAEGAAGGNVPLVRVLDANGARLLSVYRQNLSSDRVYVQQGGLYAQTSGSLPLGTWKQLDLVLIVQGTTSSVEVRLDSAVVYTTATANVAAPVAIVQLGNEVKGQKFDLAADDVVASSQAAGPGTPCEPSHPAPSNSDPGALVIAESFEDGIDDWSGRTAEEGGTVTIGPPPKTGRCSLLISVPNEADRARANIRKGLPAGTDEVWAAGWFNTLAEYTSSGWNNPTFRIMTAGKRVFDVSRSTQSGNFFVRYPNPSGGWSYGSTGRSLNLQQWYHVHIHLIARDNLSTAEVWLDGVQVFSSAQVTLGVASLESVMVGAEHQQHAGTVAADDVVIKAASSPDDAALFADGFEHQFADWDHVGTSGAGTVTTQSDIVASGSAAARLKVPDAGAYANLREEFEASQTDLTTAFALYVEEDAGANSWLPVLTFLDPGGRTVAALWRRGGTGTLLLKAGGRDFDLPDVARLDTWVRVELRIIARQGVAGTATLTLDGAQVYRSDAISTGLLGTKEIRFGAPSTGQPFSVLLDDVRVVAGDQGYRDSTVPKLLVADNLNRRLLIIDYFGRIVWKMDNPTGRQDYSAGPLGVRWLPGQKILATFGTGEVGVIDVATKAWDWKTSGYGGDAFQSPYDAELLPDGNLAVATRFNEGGRVTVYDRSTGAVVWKHLLNNAHSVHYRTPEQSYQTDYPTLLIGGWSNVREIAYRPGGGQNVTWQAKTEFTHDAIVVENDRVLTTEGYYVQKIDRSGAQLWRRSTPDEEKRAAINPQAVGGYVLSLAEADRIEFRDVDGYLIRYLSQLSDSSTLDFPYGVQVIDYPG